MIREDVVTGVRQLVPLGPQSVSREMNTAPHLCSLIPPGAQATHPTSGSYVFRQTSWKQSYTDISIDTFPCDSKSIQIDSED